jgi:O-acetylhomoserine/O-acetylserine sulfhydrylase-like pyridoxal-dependent enzyme
LPAKEEAFIYSRWSNPTVEAVERKIAALEAFELRGDRWRIRWY